MSPRGVSKTQWLELALETLRSEGIEGVKIGRMAEKLGIARSGFYWHFENIEDLHGQILEYWDHEYSEIVMRDEAALEGAPHERLARVIEMVEEYDLGAFDLAIQAWGRRDPRAREVFDRVYASRFAFIRSIIDEAGHSGPELDLRARAFISFTALKGQLWGLTEASDEALRKIHGNLFLR